MKGKAILCNILTRDQPEMKKSKRFIKLEKTSLTRKTLYKNRNKKTN